MTRSMALNLSDSDLTKHETSSLIQDILDRLEFRLATDQDDDVKSRTKNKNGTNPKGNGLNAIDIKAIAAFMEIKGVSKLKVDPLVRVVRKEWWDFDRRVMNPEVKDSITNKIEEHTFSWDHMSRKILDSLIRNAKSDRMENKLRLFQEKTDPQE